MKTATIINAKGQKFEAKVFTDRTEAQRYAVAHPVLIRNRAGSLLRHAAQIHTLKNGKFAVI